LAFEKAFFARIGFLSSVGMENQAILFKIRPLSSVAGLNGLKAYPARGGTGAQQHAPFAVGGACRVRRGKLQIQLAVLRVPRTAEKRERQPACASCRNKRNAAGKFF
jgi:hypothetical protein